MNFKTLSFYSTLIATLLVALVSFAEDTELDDGAHHAVLLRIEGAIGPATSDYFIRGVEQAEKDGAKLVILTMDTPGGLDSSMRDMIKVILSSPIPVVTYVSPSGSRAASAGTYILYASHVAAMAPATNLGAATPVQIGGAPTPVEPQKDAESEDGNDGEGADEDTKNPPLSSPSTAMERKAINDAIAYIRGLAEKRGRNAEWAEEAVRDAVSLPAEEALERNVIDLLARDLSDLLVQLDGRVVEIEDREVSLSTAGMIIDRIEPDWRTQLLSVITNPNVAYLLMLVGIYGLIFEGYNPGAIVPGVVGAISLLLALFAFQVLPVNYAGLALILLGVILMIAEVFAPSFGALGIGGVVAFVIGSVILIDTDVPGFAVSKVLIGSVGLIGSVTLMAIIGFAVRARVSPVITGHEQLVGSIAEATKDFEEHGTVRVLGELWNARSKQPVERGQRVRVISVDGLLLDVEAER